MKRGALLAFCLGAATVAFIVIGTIWPIPSAVAFAGGERLLESSSTPEAAARNLGQEIRLKDWGKAYSSLANKSQFTEQEFIDDVTGYDR